MNGWASKRGLGRPPEGMDWAEATDADRARLRHRPAAGTLEVKVDPAVLRARPLARQPGAQRQPFGHGRDVFALFRETARPADRGGGVLAARRLGAADVDAEDDVQWSADHV